MLAKTLYGLEEVLAEELKALGADNIVVQNRAVSFSGNKELLYKANLYLRTALKILVTFAQFKASDELSLYRGVSRINWDKYMRVDDTFAIDAVVKSPHFNHSKYVALKTKDAIVDQFRRKYDKRPSIDVDMPDLRINVHISNDTCSLALDSSGDPLNRRGYRVTADIAPINEVLAAGMIMLAGWKGETNLIDPMCGSGTILIEAAMIALNIPANIKREEYAFKLWSDFDQDLWDRVYSQAKNQKGKFSHLVYGSDVSPNAFLIAQKNILNSGLKDYIKLSIRDFKSLEPPTEPGLMISNPPYGERIKPDDVNKFYAMIGERLKHHYSGYDAWIISSNIEAFKHVGLKPSVKKTLFNGALECRFMKYSMYKGSKKENKQ